MKSQDKNIYERVNKTYDYFKQKTLQIGNH